jgi:hypothetical protein
MCLERREGVGKAAVVDRQAAAFGQDDHLGARAAQRETSP